MPYTNPINFTHKQIQIIKDLMKELGYNDINKLIRRALSIFNSMVDLSSGPNKKVWIVKGDPEDLTLSHDKKYYILDTSKIRLLSIPLLKEHKK